MTESEDRLRTAIDAAEMGIGHWNRTVRRITFAGHVRRVFGCDPADLPDTPHALLDLVHPDDRETVATRLLATASDGARFDADVRVRQPDGRYEWVSAQAQCHDRCRRPLRGCGRHRSQYHRAPAQRRRP